MEWLIAVCVVILIAMWIISHAGDNRTTPGRPKDCSCLWFVDTENQPYRSLADVNCRHHRGS